MNDLTTISTLTGLSDEELSFILGVSKGTVYNSKMKISPLPKGAMLKMGQIHASLVDPEILELATRELRERELEKIKVVILYREARMPKLRANIKNEEYKLAAMKHSLEKRVRAVQTRFIGIQINEADKDVLPKKLDKQKADLAEATGKFMLHGPSEVLKLSLDIQLLRSELEALTQQVEKLHLMISQIKELPVAEWPLLLNDSIS